MLRAEHATKLEHLDKAGRYEKLKQKLKQIESQMVSQERASRRNNLVITGLKIEGDNIKDVLEKFLIDEFQLPNALRAARNLGSMVLATMDSWDTALDILMRKKKVLGDRRIFISQDLPRKDRYIAS